MKVKGKLLTFVEVPIFVKRIEELGGLDLLTAIEDELIENPERGAVIKGTNGARKARIADPRKRGGKSGGLRYIYTYFVAYDRIYLLYLYGKGEQSELTATQKKQLGEVIKEAKEMLRDKHNSMGN